MSDALANRGRVLVVAATNRPDLVDAALRRPGRLDKKIPFLVPDAEERAGILAALAARYGLPLAAVPAACVQGSEGWTGAELEAAMLKASELVEDEGLSASVALERAVATLSPSTADIEYMTLLALAECNDSDLLPERYHQVVRDRAALAQQVAELAPSGPRPRVARAL
jgi:SpoVK/Ycf46/Vps4 family AAA+-type ATPase